MDIYTKEVDIADMDITDMDITDMDITDMDIVNLRVVELLVFFSSPCRPTKAPADLKGTRLQMAP